MDYLEPMAEELFKRQIRYKAGRYQLKTPLGDSERMNWFSSIYWAMLQEEMIKTFGNDFYVHEYYVGNLTGYLFGSKITKLVKTKMLVAPMIALIVKRFGYGDIKPIKTDYTDNWLTFEFYDLPTARERAKFFGYQKIPIDYTIAGLISGSAEVLLNRKFIVLEEDCIAKGDNACTFHTLSIENFKKKLKGISNKEQKDILKKALALEEKIDFKTEIRKLLKNQNKKAIRDESEYLRRAGI